MARFEIPNVPFNEEGWGPCTLPAHLKDVPYAPYGKGDKIGRVADWTGVVGGKRGTVIQMDDEDSFRLVDNNKPERKVGFRNRRKKVFKDREAQGGPTTGARQQQQPKRKDQWNYYHRESTRYKYTSSVDIRPEWTVLEQIQLSSLNKLNFKASEATTHRKCGALCFYDKTYDRVTPRNEITLKKQGFARRMSVTASEDRVLQSFGQGEDGNELKIFTTDMVLATLMCAPRSVYSWDILVTKQGNKLFFDKREESVIDEVTVSETSPEPIPPEKESINGKDKLSKEATVINHIFPQQVLKQGGEKYDLGSPSPFATEEQPSTMGHVYKSWDLGDKYTVYARCDVDGVMDSKGSTVLANFRAMNEFDPRVTGVDWRQKIENQRGAVLATELKNNSNKLSKWTAQAVLGDVEMLKLGYVTRVHHKDNSRHSIIGTQAFKPKDFATQINLNTDNCWGIVHVFIDMFAKLNDGTFLILKDPNRPMMRIYETPKNAFDSNYTEELLPQTEQAPPQAATKMEEDDI